MSSRERFLDALQQQKLPSHNFTFGPIFVYYLTFFLGTLCVGIGIALTYAASQIQEIRFSYADQTNATLEFSVDLSKFHGDVFVYYELERFQELYYSMRSYDYMHFADANYSFICTGETENDRRIRNFVEEYLSEKYPLIANAIYPFLSESRASSKNPQPVPCGIPAKHFFNDTVSIRDPNGTIANFTNKNIAWPCSLQYFNNPKPYNESNRCSSFINSATGLLYPRPTLWKQDICDLESAMENEDFIVWMVPAYAMTFRKLWKQFIIKEQTNQSEYKDGLGELQIKAKKNYTIIIKNKWLIKSDPKGNILFNKSVVISTANWAGGKNNFLGYAYLIVGMIILLIG